ncbi:MAG: glutamate-cysteine ligase family protein [Myxococcota bacterium]
MSDEQPLTRDALIAAYHESGRPRDRWLVGAEFERHLLGPDGMPLPYPGVPGVRWLMDELVPNGWTPYLEGDHPIALTRHQPGALAPASVTLEPGGQFELSGAPWKTVGEVVDEARAFGREVDAALDGTGFRQVALGFTPYAKIGDVGWVPKGRYSVMREYLAETGSLSHHMMKGTAAVQATYDFGDERDCARKVRLAILLGPLTTGTFANSPYAEGRPSGYTSWRGQIWTATDPARTGFPEAAERFSFERWVDWLLSVPMMFIKGPDGGWQFARGRTFADWMASTDGHRPDAAAWELHLTSVFPEVRIKRAIEIRGADCVPLPLAAGFAALWKGLLYDDTALDRATEVAQRFASFGTQRERFEVACRHGLAGRIGDRTLAQWAEEVLGHADAGLAAIDPGDRVHLGALRAQIATGKSPGQQLLEALGDRPDPADLAERAPMLG